MRTGTLRGDSGRLGFILRQLAGASRLSVVLVNVFAGVTDLSEFVELLLSELEQAPPAAPLVVRLDGRDAARARERLAAAGLHCVTTLEELIDAARRTVAQGSSR